VIDIEELKERREARARRHRRRTRRRRAAAVLVLTAGVAAVVLVATPAAHHTSGKRRSGAAAVPPPSRQTSRAAANPRRVAAPILMYHVIGAPPPGAAFPALYVPPREFAAQMRALASSGWTAVTLDRLWDAWTRGAPLPAGRPIVITFDNGYESQFNAALPALRRMHWPAVLNLQLTGLPRSQGGLSEEAIRRLIASGWELDTQGYSHADLVRLGPAGLRHEVADARRVLQRRWRVPVHWFCYPSGHYDARVVAAVRAAGYRGSTTVVPGWARRTNDAVRLPRIRVVAGTSPAALEDLIAAARHHTAPPAAYG
jgi:peptidoglycan/xylan/chitin deacetylase (PgdA/CDA1 family)